MAAVGRPAPATRRVAAAPRRPAQDGGPAAPVPPQGAAPGGRPEPLPAARPPRSTAGWARRAAAVKDGERARLLPRRGRRPPHLPGRRCREGIKGPGRLMSVPALPAGPALTARALGGSGAARSTCPQPARGELGAGGRDGTGREGRAARGEGVRLRAAACSAHPKPRAWRGERKKLRGWTEPVAPGAEGQGARGGSVCGRGPTGAGSSAPLPSAPRWGGKGGMREKVTGVGFIRWGV